MKFFIAILSILLIQNSTLAQTDTRLPELRKSMDTFADNMPNEIRQFHPSISLGFERTSPEFKDDQSYKGMGSPNPLGLNIAFNAEYMMPGSFFLKGGPDASFLFDALNEKDDESNSITYQIYKLNLSLGRAFDVSNLFLLKPHMGVGIGIGRAETDYEKKNEEIESSKTAPMMEGFIAADLVFEKYFLLTPTLGYRKWSIDNWGQDITKNENETQKNINLPGDFELGGPFFSVALGFRF